AARRARASNSDSRNTTSVRKCSRSTICLDPQRSTSHSPYVWTAFPTAPTCWLSPSVKARWWRPASATSQRGSLAPMWCGDPSPERSCCNSKTATAPGSSSTRAISLVRTSAARRTGSCGKRSLAWRPNDSAGDGRGCRGSALEWTPRASTGEGVVEQAPTVEVLADVGSQLLEIGSQLLDEPTTHVGRHRCSLNLRV